MQHQPIQTFLFILTPKKLVDSHTGATSNNKSILIKLGNLEGKTKSLHQSIQLEIPITYSSPLKKYSNIKGLIKIYDVLSSQQQKICCVGAINSEELWAAFDSSLQVHKQIGSLIFTFEVQIHQTFEKENASQNYLIKDKENQSYLQNLTARPLAPTQQALSILTHESPMILDDSLTYEKKAQQISASRSSVFSEDIKSQEMAMIAEQLVEERRKTSLLQAKLEKSFSKTHSLKKQIQQRNEEIKLYLKNFRSLISCLQPTTNGQYIFQVLEEKRTINLHFKEGVNVVDIFEDFLKFLSKKVRQNGSLSLSSDLSSSSQSQLEASSKTHKVRELEDKVKSTTEYLKTLQGKLKNLQQQMIKNEQKMKKNEKALEQKKHLIEAHEATINELSKKKLYLSTMNQYMKDREDQLQKLVASKESTIQNTRKAYMKIKKDFDAVESDNNEMRDHMQNLQLIIEEMKEQNADLVQTIETYRETYGELKKSKDRDLQLQIKQCMRWIDLQDREGLIGSEESIFYEESRPELASSLKAMSQLEGLSPEEITRIRKQAMDLIRKIDETARGKRSSLKRLQYQRQNK